MFAGDIFDFDYDALVQRPAACAAAAVRVSWLRVAGAAAVVARGRRTVVKTASAWQVREPLYRSSSGRARHYANELQELRDYLADFLPA